MQAIVDLLDAAVELSHPVAPICPQIKAAEVSDIFRLAVQLSRSVDWTVDDLWLGFSYDYRHFALELCAGDDGVTCLMDIYHSDGDVVLADCPLIEGLHIPWICVE